MTTLVTNIRKREWCTGQTTRIRLPLPLPPQLNRSCTYCKGEKSIKWRFMQKPKEMIKFLRVAVTSLDLILYGAGSTCVESTTLRVPTSALCDARLARLARAWPSELRPSETKSISKQASVYSQPECQVRKQIAHRKENACAARTTNRADQPFLWPCPPVSWKSRESAAALFCIRIQKSKWNRTKSTLSQPKQPLSDSLICSVATAKVDTETTMRAILIMAWCVITITTRMTVNGCKCKSS